MYNPTNAKETASLEPDTVMDGEIVDIKDGKVKDFILNVDSWKGNLDQAAIDMDVKCGDVTFTQLYTYNDKEGVTEYSSVSNMGKYKKKYGKLPEKGDKVKVLTNSDGFGKIKVE